MECKTRSLLNRYVDNELPPPKMQEVRRHVSSCSECRSFLDELIRIDNKILVSVCPESSCTFDKLKNSIKAKTGLWVLPVPGWSIVAACLIMLILGAAAGTFRAQTTIDYQNKNTDVSYVYAVSAQTSDTGIIYNMSKENL